MKSPEQHNALVNAVARQMTAGDAPPMRARVVARLEGLPRGKSRDRSPRPMFWTMGAVATAACAVMVMMIVNPGPEGPGLREPAVARPAIATPVIAAATGNSRSDPSGGTSERSSFGAPDLQVGGSPSSDQLAWQAAAVPTLDEPAPLALDAIQPERLDVRPLGMVPLEIPAIGAEEDE